MSHEHATQQNAVAGGVGPDGLVGRSRCLAGYSCRFSKHDFTLHQLYAILALKHFLKTDYRGIVQVLADWSDLRRLDARGNWSEANTISAGQSNFKFEAQPNEVNEYEEITRHWGQFINTTRPA